MVDRNEVINLYEAKKASTLQVVSIPNIGLLENLGLYVGTEIVIQNRYRFGGPVLLRVRDAYQVAIGKDIAKQVTVKEVSTS